MMFQFQNKNFSCKVQTKYSQSCCSHVFTEQVTISRPHQKRKILDQISSCVSYINYMYLNICTYIKNILVQWNSQEKYGGRCRKQLKAGWWWWSKTHDEQFEREQTWPGPLVQLVWWPKKLTVCNKLCTKGEAWLCNLFVTTVIFLHYLCHRLYSL